MPIGFTKLILFNKDRDNLDQNLLLAKGELFLVFSEDGSCELYSGNGKDPFNLLKPVNKGGSSVINVSIEYPLQNNEYYTLGTAIVAVELNRRLNNQIVIFKDNTDDYRFYQFTGNIDDYEDESKWVQIVYGKKETISNLSVSNGGTGRTTLDSGKVLIGDGINPISFKDFDQTPTDSSDNLLTSGTIKTALDLKIPKTDIINNSVDGGTDKVASAEVAKDLQHQITQLQEAAEFEDFDDFELIANKVITLSSSSTDTEYPSAKITYDTIENVNSTLSNTINDLDDNLTDYIDDINADLTSAIEEVQENLDDFIDIANDTFEIYDNKTSTINDESTADEYTTAQGVYEAIKSLNFDITIDEDLEVTLPDNYLFGSSLNVYKSGNYTFVMNFNNSNDTFNSFIRINPDKTIDKIEVPMSGLQHIKYYWSRNRLVIYDEAAVETKGCVLHPDGTVKGLDFSRGTTFVKNVIRDTNDWNKRQDFRHEGEERPYAHHLLIGCASATTANAILTDSEEFENEEFEVFSGLTSGVNLNYFPLIDRNYDDTVNIYNKDSQGMLFGHILNTANISYTFVRNDGKFVNWVLPVAQAIGYWMYNGKTLVLGDWKTAYRYISVINLETLEVFILDLGSAVLMNYFIPIKDTNKIYLGKDSSHTTVAVASCDMTNGGRVLISSVAGNYGYLVNRMPYYLRFNNTVTKGNFEYYFASTNSNKFITVNRNTGVIYEGTLPASITWNHAIVFNDDIWLFSSSSINYCTIIKSYNTITQQSLPSANTWGNPVIFNNKLWIFPQASSAYALNVVPNTDDEDPENWYYDIYQSTFPTAGIWFCSYVWKDMNDETRLILMNYNSALTYHYEINANDPTETWTQVNHYTTLAKDTLATALIIQMPVEFKKNTEHPELLWKRVETNNTSMLRMRQIWNDDEEKYVDIYQSIPNVNGYLMSLPVEFELEEINPETNEPLHGIFFVDKQQLTYTYQRWIEDTTTWQAISITSSATDNQFRFYDVSCQSVRSLTGNERDHTSRVWLVGVRHFDTGTQWKALMADSRDRTRYKKFLTQHYYIRISNRYLTGSLYSNNTRPGSLMAVSNILDLETGRNNWVDETDGYGYYQELQSREIMFTFDGLSNATLITYVSNSDTWENNGENYSTSMNRKVITGSARIGGVNLYKVSNNIEVALPRSIGNTTFNHAFIFKNPTVGSVNANNGVVTLDGAYHYNFWISNNRMYLTSNNLTPLKNMLLIDDNTTVGEALTTKAKQLPNGTITSPIGIDMDAYGNFWIMTSDSYDIYKWNFDNGILIRDINDNYSHYIPVINIDNLDILALPFDSLTEYKDTAHWIRTGNRTVNFNYNDEVINTIPLEEFGKSEYIRNLILDIAYPIGYVYTQVADQIIPVPNPYQAGLPGQWRSNGTTRPVLWQRVN